MCNTIPRVLQKFHKNTLQSHPISVIIPHPKEKGKITMEKIFPTKEIQVDAIEIVRARDLIIEATDGLEHLNNLLLVISFGINQLTFAERDYETSCIEIIRKYIATLREEKLTVASTKLDQQIKGNDA